MFVHSNGWIRLDRAAQSPIISPSSKRTGHSNWLVNDQWRSKHFIDPDPFFVTSSKAQRESANIFMKAVRKLCLSLAPELQIDPNRLTSTLRFFQRVVNTLSSSKNSVLSSCVQLRPMGETFNMPLRNSMNVPLRGEKKVCQLVALNHHD